jgi:serine/threonine protein phosphatase PrpC
MDGAVLRRAFAVHHRVCALQEGDWIVLASDGLYDNMYDEELVQILVRGALV